MKTGIKAQRDKGTEGQQGMMNRIDYTLFQDNCGEPYSIEEGRAEHCSVVMDMYRGFSPRPASQGLPPGDPETCEKWVKEILSIGENALAKRGEKIIGHASLIPDRKGKTGEFVIFVHQDSRNRGVGTELTRWIFDRARVLGFESIWLTVAMSNFIAIKLYKKLGFQDCDMDECERTMILKLGMT